MGRKNTYHFLVEIINNDNTITVQACSITDELHRPMNNDLVDNMKARLYELYTKRGMNVFNITFSY